MDNKAEIIEFTFRKPIPRISSADELNLEESSETYDRIRVNLGTYDHGWEIFFGKLKVYPLD